ncbi:MAG: hypothetical protein HW405_578, partial [Candidatus Berkelbacteria bacterium]|nr:hypothetical protein [Candidatus Berkelbacteria bacterium]
MKTLKVWTAIWAVVVLVVLVVPCFAQGDRSVTVDPSQQNAGQGSAQTGDQASGGVGGYRPAPTGQDTRKAAPANQATPSAVYAAYNHGKTILRTHTREIRTVVGHTDHQDPYREVKSWNPASRSYVDARDERTLREANAYTDGAIAGSRTESKGGHTPMGASPNDWSGPLPLLLPLLALLLLILVALSWGRIRSWFARLFAGPVVSPVIVPDATNRVYGSHHGSQTPTSTVTMFRQPDTYLRILKAGCNRRMSDSWIWAPAGGRVALTWFPGDEVRFLVQVHNPSRMDVPAGHVILNDAFEVATASGMTR